MSTTECRLSDKSQAAVTLYTTAFITIVSTITDRTLIESFMLAWIAWFPAVRGAVGVVIFIGDVVDHAWMYFRMSVLRNRQPAPDNSNVSTRPWLQERRFGRVSWLPGPNAEAGILSHILWWFWHLYVPFSQWSWFIEHRRTANFGNFFARGTAVGMSLVVMSFDYKTRVIRAIGVKCGPLPALFMCLLSFIARLSLLGLMSLELIVAAIKLRMAYLIVIYIIFSIFWGLGSFSFITGRDDDDPGESGFYDRFFNVHIILRPFAGLFFACFTCTIAFIIFTSSASNGLSIGAFVKCTSTSVWKAIQSVVF
jgi:hypothetical protein